MSRLQIVVAVGFFLIVALFGWKTYLEKSAQKNRIDYRGLPIDFQNKVKAYKAKQPTPKPVVAEEKAIDPANSDEKKTNSATAKNTAVDTENLTVTTQGDKVKETTKSTSDSVKPNP